MKGVPYSSSSEEGPEGKQNKIGAALLAQIGASSEKKRKTLNAGDETKVHWTF